MLLTICPEVATHAVLHIDNATSDEDQVMSLAYKDDGLFYYWECQLPILEYEGDKIINSWELK